MSQTSPQAQDNARRSIGAERFLTFSDAVVAIAATLLVLPLVSVAASSSGLSVGDLLGRKTGSLFAFVLSFFVIYRFWTAHHLIFSAGVQLTPALRRLNGLWLFSIVFLPVPTQLIGSKADRSSDALYIATLLVAVLTTEASQWLIARAAGQPAMETTLSVLPMPVATVVALVLAIAVPSIGLWALLLLFVAGIVQSRFLRPWAAHGASAHSEQDRPSEQAGQEKATGAPGV
jgi:uncharacterized membrane protein